LWQRIGDKTNTIHLARTILKSATNQAPELALTAYLLWQEGKTNAATKAFKQIRAISSRFDLGTPIFARLAPIARDLDLEADWRVPPPKRNDVGSRPSLESLGPFRWQPYYAPGWTLTDSERSQRALSDYAGRPVLVAFYLGSGCQHCLEQLNLLASAAKEFDALGISIIAVSTESLTALERTAAKSKLKSDLPFPIVADDTLKIFKAYRAYDDFEKMPLHGTFLIDGEGKVRWQDISYEPFTDLRFLASESRRLLAIGRRPLVARATLGK